MQYTLEQIREALKELLHNQGELWFGGEEDDWIYKWQELQDILNRLTKRAADSPKLCALCDNPTDNQLCDSCWEKLSASG